jgi:DNA-binding MarR family transcriptional regulator
LEIIPRNLHALVSRIRERINRLLIRELERHDVTGLVPSHGQVMVNLFYHPQLTMTDLARRIDRDKSTVTALVDKLAELGFVEKFKDEGDQRVTWVRTTPEGRSLIPAFKQMQETYLKTLFKGLSAQEQETLVQLLARVYRNLDGY